ncbi:hypothetical protein [Halorubrum sp. BOL3-1]|uniref:hypothetical protein n=1 Tax=Halorubrum sp. BOL3-1 TaxID=2497325 RepID=UPI003742793C
MTDAERSPLAPAGRRRSWFPFLGVAAVVLVASVVPVPDLAVGGGSGGEGTGPFAVLGPTGAFHLVGYAALAALAYRATATGGRETGSRVTEGRGVASPAVAGAVAVAAATGFGFGVELVQAPIPWRSFAWGDAAVNAVGAAVGVATVWAFVALRRVAQ